MRKLFILLLTLLCVTGVARGQDETVTGYDCECLIDGVSVKHATMPPDGGQARWQIDAAAIPLGLHQVQTRIVQHLSSGITAMAVYDALCFRVADGNSHQVTATCQVDGHVVKTSTLPANGTAQAWLLDLSDLPEGLHRVNVSITDKDRDGIVTTTSYDAMCYRASTGSHHEVTAKIYVDDQLKKTSTLPTDGSLQTFVLDLSDLPEGLHQVRVNIADKNKKGIVATAVYDAMCYRMSTGSHHEVTATCYVDGELMKKSSVQANGATLAWVLDLSELPEGIHQVRVDIADKNKEGFVATAIYEATCYRMAHGEGHDVTATCYVDDKQILTQELVADGVARTWTLDMADLPVGLHRLKVSIADKNKEGVVSIANYDAMFYRISTGETHDVTAVCYVDEQLVSTTTMPANGAAKTWTLDLATLPKGIHHVRVSVTDKDSEGIATTAMYDAMCYRSVGRIIDYEYWVNDDDSSHTKAELAVPQEEYTLISLLPVPKQEIRSKKFHFEVNDGEPMLYARNDILVRFNTEDGSFADVNGEYVDYRTSRTVEDVALLQPGETKTAPRPQENEILWYKVEAVRGDSLSFKADRACTVQIFSPLGEELKVASGEKSLSWMGVHAPADGTYYIAQRDMTATQGNTLSISYEHIDRYAILEWDVHTVGNGGPSTITFNGNGFYDLYAIDLVNAENDSIHHFDLDRYSNSGISVIFDFFGVRIGKYDAVFHFVDEDLRINDLLNIEEARDIELDLLVTYPNTHLRGTATTYTIKITNNGNMTAYGVPIYTYIENSSKKGVSYIKYDLVSANVPDEIRRKGIEGLNVEEVEEIIQILNEVGDDIYFLRQWALKDSISNDSIMIRTNYQLLNIPPNSTLTFTLQILSSDAVEVWVTMPQDWFALSDSVVNSTNRNAPKANEFCCVRDNIECFLTGLSTALDIASWALGIATACIPNDKTAAAALATAIAGCFTALANDGVKAFGNAICEGDYEALRKWIRSLKRYGTPTISAGSALSCVAAVITGAGLEYKVAATACSMLSSLIGGASIGTDFLGDLSCIFKSKDKKPNCPPNPHHGGGKSSPVAPADPNEMLGYLAPSGSKYIGKDVTDVYYTICFENDTMAMAPANVIVLSDTLDSRVHDLNTFVPKQIRIGNRLETLDGTPNFIRTIDMRPDINCIAQVECNYDSSKGIATWTLSSLDPMTLEPVTDYNQGLLPVNYNGNGQGEVSYDISLKKGLAEGTQIINHAAITFDSNDPIMTPDWVNIIDGVKPSSRAIDCELLNDSVAAVSIRGEDDRSGPWRYDIYAQYGGGEWVKAASEVPIDRAAQVRVYEGIEHHFYALLTDSAGNVEVKEPLRELTFDYFSSDTETNLTLNLAKGWNWISHNLNSPLSVDVLKPNAYRIMSHNGETINDPRYGYTGTVSTMSPTELYKVEMSTADNIALHGNLFNSALKPVPLVAGWNWIGYPMPGVMSVNEALVLLEADEDDCIVGQDGTAVYNDGLWRGTLSMLEPGKGYLLKVNSDRPLRFNTSRSSVRLHAPAVAGQNMELPWTVDIYRYPNVTPVIADLWDGYTLTSNVGYALAAFVGDECRGIATEVNGRWMMNVYGIGGEKVTFKALDRSTGLVHDVTEIEAFTADLLGTMALPVQLHIANGSGLNNVMFDDVDVEPTLTTGPVTVTASAAIDEVMVINMAGMTVMGYSNIPSGFTLDLGSEPDGVYLIQVHTGSHISTAKVMKRSR